MVIAQTDVFKKKCRLTQIVIDNDNVIIYNILNWFMSRLR